MVKQWIVCRMDDGDSIEAQSRVLTLRAMNDDALPAVCVWNRKGTKCASWSHNELLKVVNRICMALFTKKGRSIVQHYDQQLIFLFSSLILHVCRPTSSTQKFCKTRSLFEHGSLEHNGGISSINSVIACMWSTAAANKGCMTCTRSSRRRAETTKPKALSQPTIMHGHVSLGR